MGGRARRRWLVACMSVAAVGAGLVGCSGGSGDREAFCARALEASEGGVDLAVGERFRPGQAFVVRLLQLVPVLRAGAEQPEQHV